MKKIIPPLKNSILWKGFSHTKENIFDNKNDKQIKPNNFLNYDVVIIGGGVAGLSCAIKIKQLFNNKNKEISVCIIEKGKYIGAHIISGAIIETSSLEELLPEIKEKKPEFFTKVEKSNFYFLTKKRKFLLPKTKEIANKNNYIISLGKLCGFLEKKAKNLNIEILTSLSAKNVFSNNTNSVVEVVDSHGKKYQIKSKYLVLAEGARGSVTKKTIKKYNLDKNTSPQTYGLGIKETWKVAPENYKKGEVLHTIGYPLNSKAYGGGFLYNGKKNTISVGLITGLDYKNPKLSPYEEFQKLKDHPEIKRRLKNAKQLEYGAKVINEGGIQSIPKLNFPKGIIIGCSAGFLNVGKIKGIHTSIKSAIIAAETLYEKLMFSDSNLEIFNEKIKKSSICKELYKVRNIRPSFAKFGFLGGLIYSSFSHFIKGLEPWTFKHKGDHINLNKPLNLRKNNKNIMKDECAIVKFQEDKKRSFWSSCCDRFKDNRRANNQTQDNRHQNIMNSLSYSKINYSKKSKCHLQFKNKNTIISTNFNIYGSPETFYCPAFVYEIDNRNEKKPKLRVNYENCLHCMTCDIKDPTQNIDWTVPDGGDGPNYEEM